LKGDFLEKPIEDRHISIHEEKAAAATEAKKAR